MKKTSGKDGPPTSSLRIKQQAKQRHQSFSFIANSCVSLGNSKPYKQKSKSLGGQEIKAHQLTIIKMKIVKPTYYRGIQLGLAEKERIAERIGEGRTSRTQSNNRSIVARVAQRGYEVDSVPLQSPTIEHDEEEEVVDEHVNGVVVTEPVEDTPKPARFRKKRDGDDDSDDESFEDRFKLRNGKESAIRAFEVETVIFDDELSAGQLRNLEKAFGGDVRVCDRTPLILDIINQRAATHEAALQASSDCLFNKNGKS
ncbi:hypothetical protein V6N12_071121 [Hibiscus sabdariffa]|uniref:GTPase HflX N-terminal domain-containing protein n=1 Tax=Hibiscus sabdariffa TaxID=183260 RepID=A0ABR2FIU5_9ROSI